jgi:hypothetical protein
MFMNGKNGYFIRCTFMNALNVDYSPDFFISVLTGPSGWFHASSHLRTSQAPQGPLSTQASHVGNEDSRLRLG